MSLLLVVSNLTPPKLNCHNMLICNSASDQQQLVSAYKHLFLCLFCAPTDWVMQDWMQQQQRHKAALETEIKTLRSQIGQACFAFDDSLVNLQMQRTAAESELTITELQHVSLTGFYEQQQFLQSELQNTLQQLSKLHEQLDDKRALVLSVTQALIW